MNFYKAIPASLVFVTSFVFSASVCAFAQIIITTI